LTACLTSSEHGFLDPNVDVDTLARATKNYTGAEIEGVCKAAASYAFERNIDKSNIDKEHADGANIKVPPPSLLLALPVSLLYTHSPPAPPRRRGACAGPALSGAGGRASAGIHGGLHSRGGGDQAGIRHVP
jgi:SpoVK/Ycf46/Vps4 family AAA+-type ATPase